MAAITVSMATGTRLHRVDAHEQPARSAVPWLGPALLASGMLWLVIGGALVQLV
jgi:hypothetical protein